MTERAHAGTSGPTSLIAIGVGCRKSCLRASIVALVRSVVADCAVQSARQCLFTHADKQGDAELAAAARSLELELVFLPREALEAMTLRLLTRSAAAQRRFGLPSIAEAAALAGAGPGSRLIGPRRIGEGVTCAVAIAPENAMPV